MIDHSTPGFGQFNPLHIPYQAEVINQVKFDYDYKKGFHEILLSGSAGSAKSILMAHLLVRHCLEHPNARALIGRKSLPDLKSTIYKKIREHLENDPNLKQGVHWTPTDNIAQIKFANGSEIISRSWHDGNYMKFRSLDISAAAIEELTENKLQHKQAYQEICMRLDRLPHVKEKFIISATNPDAPSHWAYKHFELDKTDATRDPLKHVFYSRTADNIFLPKTYIINMMKNLDEKMFQRMGLGLWIEIASEVIYYSYLASRNFRDIDYHVDQFLPIHINWDFNIGKGKPLSVCLFQFKNGCFHFFDEVILQGADTEESCQELLDRGLLDYDTTYFIHGDATGEAKSTKSKKSDYDIINKFFANTRNKNGSAINYEMQVAKSNPPIKTRHNLVNGYCYNANKDVRLFVYKNCKTLDEGLRLTQLRDGGQYIEDDGPNCPYQHVTTAAGYGICYVHFFRLRSKANQQTPRFR
jgi:hypothetical protein